MEILHGSSPLIKIPAGWLDDPCSSEWICLESFMNAEHSDAGTKIFIKKKCCHKCLYLCETLWQPTCDFYLLSLKVQFKHFFSFLPPLTASSLSSDGSLFFVQALQNRHHAGPKQLRGLRTPFSLHPASARDGWESGCYYAETLCLCWTHRLHTFKITHKGFDSNVKRISSRSFYGRHSDVNCHIRCY